MRYTVLVYKSLAILSIAFTLISCDVKIIDTQDIEIDLFEDIEENNKVVEALVGYDPGYIIRNIPSFNDNMSKGLNLGFFRPDSDGRSRYRITYRTDNRAISDNIVSLKEEFSSYIPKLAKFHADKLPVFEKLKPSAVNIFNQLWKKSYDEVWSNGSSALKASVNKQGLIDGLQPWINNYQNPIIISYLSSQYYMPFGNIPESVSIFHQVTFENNETAILRISLQKEANEWYFMGLNFTPKNIKELI